MLQLLLQVVHNNCRLIVRLYVIVCSFGLCLLYILRQETVKFTPNKVFVSVSVCIFKRTSSDVQVDILVKKNGAVIAIIGSILTY